MTQRRALYKTTQAFPEPNYTQTPNDFFEMIPDMLDSELRVTLVMIRQTFGFHREQFTMGLKKLEDATGLSRNAVKDGADAAEKRGTFRRTNTGEQGEAEWELVVGQPVTPPQPVTGVGQPVTPSQSTSDPQVRVKETIKENKKKFSNPLWDLQHGKTPVITEEDEKQLESIAKVEEVATKLEQGLRLNFPRGTKDQQVYKRIAESGNPIDRFIEWVKAEERRLSFAFLYAKDTSALWRDFPQAFPAVATEPTEQKGSFYG